MKRIVTRNYPHRIAAMLEQSGINPVLARLFAARGLTDAREIHQELQALHPPSGLRGNAQAASYLADAIGAGKKILVVADYDCDGATACALALRGLRALGAKADYMVPNRATDGYGLSPQIVRRAAAEKSPDILLTVDNGIASVDGVDEARALGLEVVITDHHLPGAALPSAAVIVNPNQPECRFPSKHLAGVGVMFYVLLALRAEMRQRGHFDGASQPRLDNLLDLVALGTVADVVKLDANNRVLVAQGLQRIRAGRMQPGVSALFQAAGREARNATPFDLGFALGPRLNAAGRLQDMALGIECLLTDDPGHALQIAHQLNEINLQRREIETDMQAGALAALQDYDPRGSASISLFDPSWHQGVIGIVAARLKEKFYRPTFTFAQADDGLLRGSGRSIAGFHLRDALDLLAKRQPGMIDKFGGHAMAAGLSLQPAALEDFRTGFERIARELIAPADLEQIVETDGALEDQYFTTQFVQLLNGQIWGQGFPAPIFRDDFQVRSQRLLKDKHLKLVLEKNGQRYDAIWFNSTKDLPQHAEVAYRLDLNTYNGVTRTQLLVEYAQ